MLARIRRLVSRQKGMEVLQAVLLLGVAFVVAWGVSKIWSKAKPTVENTFYGIVTGNGSAQGSGNAQGDGNVQNNE